MSDFLEGITDHRLTRPDGRTVAWAESGEGKVPLVRMVGTPGCRFDIPVDRSSWVERDLRVVSTERPGFGASTRLPGRRFAEHADDVAAILDHLGIDRTHLIGGSGGAPHVLAFAARHPDRVRAATIVVGAAPVTEDEIDAMTVPNQASYRHVASGDIGALEAELTEFADMILADPIGALEAMFEGAPDADRLLMEDPTWRQAWSRGWEETFAQGHHGWLDECLALIHPWDDIDLPAVRTTLTWWHGAADANCPLTAAERLIAQLPDARLERFGDDEGHMAARDREGDILDELLARG